MTAPSYRTAVAVAAFLLALAGPKVQPAHADAGLDKIKIIEHLLTKVDTYARLTPAVLRRVLRDKRPGEYLFLEVLRGRHTVTFKARL